MPNVIPLPTHNFIVEIASASIPFSKIQSIEIGIETEALIEGGESRFVYSLTKQNNTEKQLIMERIVVSDGATHKPLRVGSLFETMIIYVLDQHKQRRKMYSVNYAMLKKRSLSELDAMNGVAFVESLEFVYRELTEVVT